MHLAGIDTNLLTTLDALLREQSVSRAARRVGLSPSATSHALGRLRAVLDDPLLVRAGRNMVLTPRAEQLAPRVRQVVQDMARIFEPEPGVRPALLEREFRFAADVDYRPLTERLLGRPVDDAAPGVRLRSRALRDDPTADLRTGALDVAVGVFDGLPDDIELQPLFVDPVVALVARGHAWGEQPPDLAAFVGGRHAVVEPRTPADRALDRALAGAGHRRRAARTVSDRAALPFAVAGSRTAAVVSHSFALAVGAPLGLVTVPLPLAVDGHRVSLAWHRRNAADPAHRWFRDLVFEQLADLPQPSADAA